MNKKIYILPPLLTLFSLALFIPKASADFIITSQGDVIYTSQGEVLGKDDAKNVKPQVSQGNSAASTGKAPKITKIERNGTKVKMTIQDEDGIELEVMESEDSANITIEESNRKNDVKVKSLGNSYAIIQNKTAVQTRFPLSVDLETNELLVNTPAGQKTVSVMPDKAVQNMLAANVLDQVGGKGGLSWVNRLMVQTQETSSSSESPEMTRLRLRTRIEETSGSIIPFGATPLNMDHCKNYGWVTFTAPEFKNQGQCVSYVVTGGKNWENAEPEVELADAAESSESSETSVSEKEFISLTTTKNGKLGYKIPGVKYEKFLWVYEVPLERNVTVSAETGELLEMEQSFTTNIVDALSF